MIELLAQLVAPEPVTRVTMVSAIRDTLRTGPDGSEFVWLIGGGLMLVLVIVIAARYRRRTEQPASESEADYLTMAVDIVGLSEQQRRDLLRIAKAAEVDQPASILLTPQNLARAAQPALRTRPEAALRGRLDDLSQALFGIPLPDVLPDNLMPGRRMPSAGGQD